MMSLLLVGWRIGHRPNPAISGRAEWAPIYRPADALAGVCGRDRTIQGVRSSRRTMLMAWPAA